MNLSVALYLTCTISAGLLTHQEITSQLQGMSNGSREKQNIWRVDSMHNELVCFESVNDNTIYSHIIDFIKDYQSAVLSARVYVVIIITIKELYKMIDTEVPKLLSRANDFIKKCKSNDLDVVNIVDGNYRFVCYEVARDKMYGEIIVFCEELDCLIYFDGSLPDYDSYNSYVGFYAEYGLLTHKCMPKVIVTLQKTHEMKQFFDILKIQNLLNVEKAESYSIVLCKIRNMSPSFPPELWNDRETVLADMTIDSRSNNSKKVEQNIIKLEDTRKFKVHYTNARYYDITRNYQCRYRSKIRHDYPGLNYSKIIGVDLLEYKKEAKNSLGIYFTYFLIKREFSGRETYEILIMVAVKSIVDTWHTYAIKYPVEDENGNDLLPRLDQNPTYYKKILFAHEGLRNILRLLHHYTVNDRGYTFSKISEFKNIFKIQDALIYDMSFKIHKVSFFQDIDTYHKKNNEFIANIKNKFEENITIKLYEGTNDYNMCDEFERDNNNYMLTDSFDAIREISLDKYIEYKKDNLNDILMHIKITDKSGNSSAYFFYKVELVLLLKNQTL